MSSYYISVIIPTYNRVSTLSNCLLFYNKQNFPYEKFEVIVIDDGSSDNTEQMIKEIKQHVNYSLKYYRKENGGPGSARNVGLSRATGEIFLIIGDDIFPDANLLLQHWEWHHDIYPENNVGILGFVTWASNPPPSPLMIWMERWVQNSYHLLNHTQIVDWKYNYTGNISLKRKFYNATGVIFEERYRIYGFEDIEWGFRLNRNGFQLRYNKNAIGLHHHWTTLDSSLKRIEKIGTSIQYYKITNPDFYDWVISDIFPKKWWKKLLLPFVLSPFIVINFVLPLARFYENKKVCPYVFSIIHMYYLKKGIINGGIKV